MDTIESITSKTKETKDVNLLVLQIKRTVKGTSLFIKSEIFENFFNAFGKNGETFRDGKDVLRESYNSPSINRNENPQLHYGLNDIYMSSLNTGDGYLNMAFLKTVGIDKGVYFKIAGLQSKKSMDNFKKKFKDNCKELYEEFIKPESFEVEIIIREGVKAA